MTKFIYGAIFGWQSADLYAKTCLLLVAIGAGTAIGLATAALV